MIPELVIAMLACARIGATHSIIFGGFSADAIADRNNDAKSKLVITADGGWRRGKEVPLKQTVDESLEKSADRRKDRRRPPHGSHVNMVPDRDYWWHELMAGTSAECDAAELDCEHPLYILYTSGSTGKPKGVLHTTAGYLLGTLMTRPLGLRSQGRRHLLVHGRRRLGDRAQLHRLRPARRRRHRRDVRRSPELARRGPLLADHREIPGQHSLHRADRDPCLRQMGRPVAGKVRSLEPAALGISRRADQSRGVDVVPASDRPGPLPHRRHLVADRNRLDHDQPASRRHADQAG